MSPAGAHGATSVSVRGLARSRRFTRGDDVGEVDVGGGGSFSKSGFRSRRSYHRVTAGYRRDVGGANDGLCGVWS